MRIKHISDSHGTNHLLTGDFDIVIHSGDMLPDNVYCQNKECLSDKDFQIKWLQSKVKKIKRQLKDKPLFFILGNHDFVEPDVVESILRAEGIDAYSLEDKIVTYNDFTMYGFPYVPYICGDFNYERDANSMRKEVSRLIKDIKGKQIDILVTHSPPYGILDKTKSGLIIGNNILTDYLTYKLDAIDCPNWLLCGHVHWSHGINCETNINVSNAATIQNIIEIF